MYLDRAKLSQVALTAICVFSVILWYITKNNIFEITLGLAAFYSMIMFNTWLYMPNDMKWKKLQKIFVGAIIASVLIALIIFPKDQNCSIDWDGFSNSEVCD